MSHRIVQHSYNRFPDDWLQAYGVVATMARFIVNKDNDRMDDDGNWEFEAEGAYLIIIIRPDFNTPLNQKALRKGINKVGLPGRWWSVILINNLPIVEDIDEYLTRDCCCKIDASKVDDWYDANDKDIVFTDAAV